MKEDELKIIEKKLMERYLNKDKSGFKSREYKMFFEIKKPKIYQFYENMIKSLNFRISMSKKEKEKKERLLRFLNIELDPELIAGASIILMLISILIGLILFILNPILGLFSVFGILVYYYIYTFPEREISKRRVRASGELVLAITYLASYMRNIPNLERAFAFTARNLTGPLSQDFMRILWELETKKFATIQEAIEDYLNIWKDVNDAFVDSMYLIISSLYQKDLNYRLQLLDEAVNRILEGTLDKMIDYAESLRNPVNAIYMMGIVLPILVTTLLPMATAFMQNAFPTYFYILFYNVLLPSIVLFLLFNFLSKRPAGFPSIDLSKHPELPKPYYFKFMGTEIHTIIPTTLIFLVFTIPTFLILSNLPKSVALSEYPVYFSLIFTFGVGLSVYLFAKLNTYQRINILKKIYNIEKNFDHAAFQLGTTLSEGLPPERALLRVINVMKGSEIKEFFERIIVNMRKLGLDFYRAVFDPKYGSLRYYPSPLIKSIMEVFFEVAKRSLKEAGVSLIFISKYLKNLRNVDKRVRDVLGEVTSSMRFQVAFLSPIMSAIVVSLATLISIIVYALSTKLKEISTLIGTGSVTSSFLLGFAKMSPSLPPYLFQIMMGVYMIEIIVLIGYAISEIEKPGDPIYRFSMIASLVLFPLIIYLIITVVATLIFSGLGKMALAIGEVGV